MPTYVDRLVAVRRRRRSAPPTRSATSSSPPRTRPAGARSPTTPARRAPRPTPRLLEGPWHLTVRHIGTLEQNGLWHADGVDYVQRRLQMSTAEIDAADVVVAGDGTFPTLAIARGVPTV